MANPNPTPRPENLRPPWKPGQSGNPSGRPKKKQTDDLLALIGEKGADRAISALWLKKILSGDFRYFKEYLDRMEGKPPEKVEVETNANRSRPHAIDDEPGLEPEPGDDPGQSPAP